MNDPRVRELKDRAAALRALADHVESLVDAAHKHSTTGMTTWSGPNATEVRGRLGSWQTTCATVAEELRGEARRALRDAKALRHPDE